MGPDDKVCYCYNIPYRKLWSFALRTGLQRPSQMSECLGAGTGCGWCVPILKRIFERARSSDNTGSAIEMSAEEYAQRRQDYIRNKEPRNQF